MVHDFVRHLLTVSPQIIEAEDLVNPNIDELSVLTYVSLLKNATPTIGIVAIGLFLSCVSTCIHMQNNIVKVSYLKPVVLCRVFNSEFNTASF